MIHILMSQHGSYSPYPLPPQHFLEDHFLFRGSGRSLGRAQRADSEELYSFKPGIAHGGRFLYSEEKSEETDDFTGSRARWYTLDGSRFESLFSECLMLCKLQQHISGPLCSNTVI